MIRNLVVAAALSLTVAPLTACSSHSKPSASDSTYCHDLSAADHALTMIEHGDVSKFDTTVQQLLHLSAEAPDEVSDEWKLIAGLFQEVNSAFAHAGVSGVDFAKIQAGELPKGVDTQALLKAAKKIQKLSSADFVDAEGKIIAQAKDQCSIDLGS